MVTGCAAIALYIRLATVWPLVHECKSCLSTSALLALLAYFSSSRFIDYINA